MLRKANQLFWSTLDPRRDLDAEAPRAFVVAKNAVEYLFRVAGFFLVLCLFAGLTFASCTQDPFLAALPFILATALFFYIAITTLGIPAFLLIAGIQNTVLRRVLGYLLVLVLLVLTAYSVAASPIFDFLLTYVGKYFPEAFDCRDGIVTLD